MSPSVPIASTSDQLLASFVRHNTAVASNCRIIRQTAISSSINEYVYRNQLTALCCAPAAARIIAACDQDGKALAPSISYNIGKATASDQLGIVVAAAGIAETGSLLMITNNHLMPAAGFLLPAHLIVLLAQSAILPGLDDINISDPEFAAASAITLLTGPSRSADIEQTLLLGAHGAKHLTIFIYS